MNRRLAIARTVLSAVVLAGVVLTGCSGGSGSSSGSSSSSSSGSSGPTKTPPAGDIVKKAHEALSAARGVHVAGRQTSAQGAFELDMVYGQDRSAGSFSSGGFDFQLRQIAGEIYVKAPDQFWKSALASNPLAVPKVAGKWVRGPATNKYLKAFAEITDIKQFSQSLFSDTAGVKKGATSSIDGAEVIALEDKTGTLFVSSSDARPIQLVGSGKDEGSKITFTDYGKTPTVTRPRADESADATTVG